MRNWSKQILVQDGSSNHLLVCYDDIKLFDKEFQKGKYTDKCIPNLPFDFIVVAGSPCPRGDFYELEYMTEEKYVVHRALIQAVDPTTDIQLILGTLREYGLIDDNFRATRAYIREDINVVNIGTCYKDEDGAVFGSAPKSPKADDPSLLKYTNKNWKLGVCLEYYGEGHTPYELWVEPQYSGLSKKVFVCGSSNVNDPEFAEAKTAALEEMKNLILDALEIADDYNIDYVVAIGDDIQYHCNGKYIAETLGGVYDALNKHFNKENNKSSDNA